MSQRKCWATCLRTEAEAEDLKFLLGKYILFRPIQLDVVELPLSTYVFI